MVKPKLHLPLILLVFLGFVSIGLPDGLIGVAWPSMRRFFGLPIDALGGLLISYTAGYLVASFNSGRTLARTGLGALLALSCLATGASLVGYAIASHWWMVISLAALAGSGAGAIDAGLNTYAATHFTTRMVNWLHAFYGLGALSGPLLMTAALLAGFRWQMGYALVGLGQLGLAIAFGLTKRRWSVRNGIDKSGEDTVAVVRNSSTLRLPVVWFSTAIFFVYSGLEAAAGAWAYSLLTEARGVPMVTAGRWVSAYWGALTLGRILSAIFAGRWPVRFLLRCCIAGQAAGALLLWLNLDDLRGLLGWAVLGVACGPIFPSLIAATRNYLGRSHLANAVGFQIAAAVLGQSLVPALVGVMARRIGLEVVAPALFASAVVLYALYEAMTATQSHLERHETMGV